MIQSILALKDYDTLIQIRKNRIKVESRFNFGPQQESLLTCL